MSRFFHRSPPKPGHSDAHSPAQPAPGGARTRYRVEGVWDADGHLQRPRRMVVVLDDNRETEKPGDVLELTRQEASVVAKRHCLVPLFDEE